MRTIWIPAAALALAGCTPNYSPNTYASTAVQQASKVEQGVVAGVRPVAVSASGATGTVAGAAAGGIAGAQAPVGGAASALTALGGSLVGGLVGAGVEHATGDTTAFEYVVRKANGDLLSVTQKDEVPLALGQKVLVISGSQARIVPDYTTSAETPHPLPSLPVPSFQVPPKVATDPIAPLVSGPPP